jgi:hypothetical protein
MPSTIEKTMNGDQSDIGLKPAGRARNKAISKMDQIRTLEISIMEYKKDANDKNWSNIDKSLQVRNCLYRNIKSENVFFSDRMSTTAYSISIIIRFRLWQNFQMESYFVLVQHF